MTHLVMRQRSLLLGFVAVLCLGQVRLVSAHHAPTHNVSLSHTQIYNPFVIGQGVPRRNLSYTFEWTHLDNGAGDLYFHEITDEYPVTERLSLTLGIPVMTNDLTFRGLDTNIGDVATGIKWLLLAAPNDALIVGARLSYPTGSRSDGTGLGVVAASPYVTYWHSFEQLTLFASAGNNTSFSSDPEPMVDTSAGLAYSFARESATIVLSLSVQTSLLLADETFAQGSYKMFAVPGFTLYPTEEQDIGITLAGRFSIVDQLSVKNGVVLQNSSLALAQDAFAGASLTFNYAF